MTTQDITTEIRRRLGLCRDWLLGGDINFPEMHYLKLGMQDALRDLLKWIENEQGQDK